MWDTGVSRPLASLDDPDAQDAASSSSPSSTATQLADLDREPFSTFQVYGTLASKSQNHKALQELRVRGNLAAKPLGARIRSGSPSS